MTFDKDTRYQIGVSIDSDTGMIELNKKYKGQDGPTDVLSFDRHEDLGNGEMYLGDIVVNRDQAKRQAADYGNSIEQEIAQLVEHGVLHLLGVHHKGDDH